MPKELLEELSLGASALVDLALSGRKVKRLGPTAEYLRDVGLEDVKRLIENPVATQHPGLKQLRHRHHLLARLLAEGKSHQEAAFVAGYDLPRVSILLNDPAFADLVRYYESCVHEVFVDAQERAKNLAIAAIDELHGRIEEEPEKFTNNELQRVAESMLPQRPAQVAPLATQGGGINIQINFKKGIEQRNDGEDLIEAVPFVEIETDAEG